jgi:hypothetical protein
MIDMAKKNEQIIRLSQPIDLRYKCVRTFRGKRKIVTTSTSEQRKFKKNILKFFPDSMFYDDLNEGNSIEAGDQVFSCSMLDKPIDIRYRCKKTIWGKRRIIEATVSEQQKVKKVLLKLFPDNLFYDDLGESNSVRIKKPRRSASEIASDMFDYAIAAAAYNQAFGDNDNDDHDCDSDDCDSDD